MKGHADSSRGDVLRFFPGIDEAEILEMLFDILLFDDGFQVVFVAPHHDETILGQKSIGILPPAQFFCFFCPHDKENGICSEFLFEIDERIVGACCFSFRFNGLQESISMPFAIGLQYFQTGLDGQYFVGVEPLPAFEKRICRRKKNGLVGTRFFLG